MGKKNHVLVVLRQKDAALCARWILEKAIPRRKNQSDSLLTPGFAAEEVSNLQNLAARLTKASQRKRNDYKFRIHISKTAIRSMEAVVVEPILSCRVLPNLRTKPRSVARLVLAMRVATKHKRGRPTLTKAARTKRINRDFAIEPRYRKRLVQKEKIKRKWDAWSREVRARNETLLTTSLPFPKI